MQDFNRESVSCKDKIKMLWSKITLISRVILIVSIVLFFLCTVLPVLENVVFNIPQSTIKRFEIWRIFTASFSISHIFLLLISLLMYIPNSIETENQMGTVKYLIFFIVMASSIQILFAIMGLIFSLFLGGFGIQPSIGLLPLFIAELIVECNKDPDLSKSFFFLPIQIKSKFFPWVLFILLSLIMKIHLDLVAGMIIGYLLSCKVLKCAFISDKRASHWEKKAVFVAMGEYTGFITQEAASQYLASIGDTLPRFDRDYNLESATSLNQPLPSRSTDYAGVRVGGSLEQMNRVDPRYQNKEEKENSEDELMQKDGKPSEFRKLVEIEDSMEEKLDDDKEDEDKD